jgi:hypothetical protein
MHDIPSAVAEARRCVTELGAVAIIGTPNPVNGQHLHDEACAPLWAEIERLGLPAACSNATSGVSSYILVFYREELTEGGHPGQRLAKLRRARL